MTLNKLLAEAPEFVPVNIADGEREISGVYCCDLLSVVMGRAPADSAWVTIMGNLNAVAVAVLTDVTVVVVAEGMEPDTAAVEKAQQQSVNVIKTPLPIFEAARLIAGKANV